MIETVTLKALDSFLHEPIGMVHARAEFLATKADADALVNAGLAQRIAQVPTAKAKVGITRTVPGQK